MLFNFLFGLGDEEGIVLVDLKAIKHKLRIRNSTTFLSYLIIKYKTFYHRYDSINKEVIGTLLNLFLDNSSSTLINDSIDLAISFMSRMH